MTVVQDLPKEDDDAQQPPDPPKPVQQSPPQLPDTGQPDSGDDGGESGESGELSIEEQLDQEKKKNIQLKRQLTKAEIDRKKASEDADVVKERDSLKAENDRIKALLSSSFLVWSIGNNSKFKWQNPEDVVKFIDGEEINIDVESGKIEGLDLALKRIAKDKPYLLVPEDGGNPSGFPLQPTGTTPGAGRTATRETEVKRLGEKYKIPGFGTAAQKFM